MLVSPIDTSQSAIHSIFLYFTSTKLTDNDLALLWEVVCGHFEVERGGSLSYAARNIVVRTVAGAEPAAEIASFADRNTSKVSADACPLLAFRSYQYKEPLGTYQA